MHMHLHMYDKCVTLGAMHFAALSLCFYFAFFAIDSQRRRRADCLEILSLDAYVDTKSSVL